MIALENEQNFQSHKWYIKISESVFWLKTIIWLDLPDQDRLFGLAQLSESFVRISFLTSPQLHGERFLEFQRRSKDEMGQEL